MYRVNSMQKDKHNRVLGVLVEIYCDRSTIVTCSVATDDNNYYIIRYSDLES